MLLPLSRRPDATRSGGPTPIQARFPMHFSARSSGVYRAFLSCAVSIAAHVGTSSGAERLPSDWIDPATGHRVIRLSPDEGGASLYFHQRYYTPEGDKMILHTRDGALVTVDISTLGVSPPKLEIIAPRTRAFATAWRTREAYVYRGDAVVAIHLDTKAEREVVKLPPQARGRQIAINCDETLLVAIGPDPEGEIKPRTAPPDGVGGTLEANWAAGTPKMIYTVDIRTGEFRVIHRENDWTNHLQCSPTDPQQIVFCHEGPWHFNDRVWTIRADGGGPVLVHERTMNMEIAGHEFFGHDGKTIWYDLQTPRSGVFWLAGLNLETGQRTWYNLGREEWSVHYNVSPDGTLFSGDGGGPTSVAARTLDGELLDPPGNGQWMYLFRPVMARGSSYRDRGALIDVGRFVSERLVDMSNHDYSKDKGIEPNGTFTPDGKWLVFSGNFHSPRVDGRRINHTYAVEIARTHEPVTTSGR
jgi:oligogalacturonide lyase